jgi:DNA-binding transcriptional MerR regulator
LTFKKLQCDFGKMKTTKEIEKLTGFSRKTLDRYVRAGWLPKPKFKSSGRYGAALYWLPETINRLSLIKSLKQAGYTNKAINEILRGVK